MQSVPLHLKIDSAVWRLPTTVNPGDIHAKIFHAMQGGDVITIPVELGDDPRGQTSLTINGRSVGQFALIELPDTTEEI